MRTTRKLMRSPLKWHGGKSKLALRIAALMPRHRIYVEPFAGGLNVLLNKPRSEIEIVGDIDERLVLFWRVVAGEDDPEGRRFWRFYSRVTFNKYEPGSFALAKGFIRNPPWPLDQIDRAEYAAFFLMWNRMSRGGLGESFAWSDRLRGGKPGDVNAWETMIAGLVDVNARLKGAQVAHCDALHLIWEHDDESTIFYLDPPYPHSTRTSRDSYEYEMDDGRHRDLLDVAKHLRGAVMISGYRCDLYDVALAGWERHEWDLPNHSSQAKAKARRTECLWIKGARS